MAGAKEVEIARNLFAAWSSGDVDAPAEFLTPDAILHDVVEGHDRVGWPRIREFFALSLRAFPDLALTPSAFYTNDEGVAVRWQLTATLEADLFGEGTKGQVVRSEGMSTLEFRDGLVCREVDFHHGGAPARSVS